MRVTGELLQELLYLPNNARVVGAKRNEHDPRDIDFQIECDDFPDLAEGAALPSVTGVFESSRPVQFVKWHGLKEGE